MIIKTFELQKLKATKAKIFLFYGVNEGYKDQIINEYFLKKFKNSTNRYDENEVLNNYDSFISNLLNKSLPEIRNFFKSILKSKFVLSNRLILLFFN